MSILLLSFLSSPSHAFGWDRGSFSFGAPAVDEVEVALSESILFLTTHPQVQQGVPMLSVDLVLKHVPEVTVTSLELSIDGVPLDTGAALESAVVFADGTPDELDDDGDVEDDLPPHTTAFFELLPAELLGEVAELDATLGLSDGTTVTASHTYRDPTIDPEILFVHEPGDFGLVPSGLQPGSVVGLVAKGLSEAHQIVWCGFGQTTLSDAADWGDCTPTPLEWWIDDAVDEGLVDDVTPVILQMPYRMSTGYGELQIKNGDEVVHRLTTRVTGFGEVIRLDQVGALFLDSLVEEFGADAYDFHVQGLYEPLEPGTVLLESYRDELTAQETAVVVPEGEWWLSVSRIEDAGLDGWMVWQLANPVTGEVLAYPQQSGWPVLQVDGVYNSLLGSRAFLHSGLFGIHTAVGVFPDILKLGGWRGQILKDDEAAQPMTFKTPAPSPSGQVPETDCVTVKRHAIVVRYGNSSEERANHARWVSLYQRKAYDTLDLLGPSTFRQPGVQGSTKSQLAPLYIPLVQKYAAEAKKEPEYCHEILLHVTGHGVDDKGYHKMITNRAEQLTDWVTSPDWWGRTILTEPFIVAVSDSYGQALRHKVPQTAVINSCFSGKLYHQTQTRVYPKQGTPPNFITYMSSGSNEFTINDYFLSAMESCTDGKPISEGWTCVAATVPPQVVATDRTGVWWKNSDRDRSQHPWVSVSAGVEPVWLKLLEVSNP